jgi:F0F1-type ATP synthase assembly protein I
MIEIASPKEQTIKRLKELENEYNQGNLPKNDFIRQKKYLIQQLEALEVADRVRRLQGKQGSEKSLDYWSEKEKEKEDVEDQEEKEELLKKYSTKPQVIEEKPGNGRFSNRAKIIISILLIVGFLVGIVFGVSVISKTSESPQVSMIVNDSAFPAKNITNITKKTTTIKKISTNRTRLTNRTLPRSTVIANNSTTP